ncbi:hypothetical protein DXG03_001927 [Asterophora parasitica]|uniref:Uncharacterized protein n=1 Tax=Asterophora parasitica TaxID=117018 RepID=A0A9P7KBG5_9AGAR|nr:hypothetical protein DXG03_001927 [Asterophora parasitica]
MARARIHPSPVRRQLSTTATPRPWKKSPRARYSRPRHSLATPSPLQGNPWSIRGFGPDDETFYDSGPDDDHDDGDDHDYSFFHWEEESTLFSDLLDAPGDTTTEGRKHDALVDSLQPAFDHRSRELKREMAETLVPTVNRVKGLYDKIGSDVDTTFGKGILVFNQACKDMEALAIKDHDELKHAWGVAQVNIERMFLDLKDAYKMRERLWADFDKAVNAIGTCSLLHPLTLPPPPSVSCQCAMECVLTLTAADPAVEDLKALPAKVERTIASLEKHAKALEKDETNAVSAAEKKIKGLLGKA